MLKLQVDLKKSHKLIKYLIAESCRDVDTLYCFFDFFFQDGSANEYSKIIKYTNNNCYFSVYFSQWFCCCCSYIVIREAPQSLIKCRYMKYDTRLIFIYRLESPQFYCLLQGFRSNLHTTTTTNSFILCFPVREF